VGLQIVGRRFADATVLRAAAAFEDAHPGEGRDLIPNEPRTGRCSRFGALTILLAKATFSASASEMPRLADRRGTLAVGRDWSSFPRVAVPNTVSFA